MKQYIVPDFSLLKEIHNKLEILVEKYPIDLAETSHGLQKKIKKYIDNEMSKLVKKAASDILAGEYVEFVM